MNGDSYAVALWFVFVWPLLLAIPALHSRLPWPRHLAIMPAVVLAVLPGDISLTLPWLQFGTTFAVTEDARWILVMAVAVWLMAATVATSSSSESADDQATTFFLLTLAGNLGAILATDLVVFFSFSTLMGYGFYGLLIQGGDVEVRRAGRLYLMFLIVADLLLFEALLLAAFSSENLQFKTVREVMAGAAASQFYLWLIIIGFALKAGIWPAHLWLTSAFRSAQPATTLLLSGVPVAMALFGALRCLPLGEQSFDGLALVLQVLAVIAMLYAAFRFFARPSIKLLPAWSCVAVTGWFIAALGTGLAHPAIWRQYEHLFSPFIATAGLLLAALSFAVARLQKTDEPPVSGLEQIRTLEQRAEQWLVVTRQWSMNQLQMLKSAWRTNWMMLVKKQLHIPDSKTAGNIVSSWRTIITLFVLLGMTLAWLAA